MPMPALRLIQIMRWRKDAFYQNHSSTGSIDISNWIWNFGDGDVSDVRGDVDHPYLKHGTYDVQLRIKATNGCADSLIHQVIVGRKPNARIGLDSGRTELCTGDKCRLSVEYDLYFSCQVEKGRSEPHEGYHQHPGSS